MYQSTELYNPFIRLGDNELDPIELANRYGWNLRELAEQLNVSYQSTKFWSNGYRKPSRSIRQKAYELNLIYER